ncbi:protein of unknown function [Methylocella tundrae]|uniref:Peptidase S24/S26A/S26B/S26C domain-containing protein n=2 Tax=Methylocella tundrae TaxID=227605 RepID=A0A4U8Z000_METTU|nr:protein of unknown function [Methylocella tundrae]
MVRKRFAEFLALAEIDMKNATSRTKHGDTYARDVIRRGRGKLDSIEEIVATIDPNFVDWVARAKGPGPTKETIRPRFGPLAALEGIIAKGNARGAGVAESPVPELPVFFHAAGAAEKPLTNKPDDNGEVIIYGGAEAVGEDFSYALQRVSGRIPRPKGLMGRPGIYAVRITDASMSPTLTKDDLVFIDAKSEARPGDDVMIEMHPILREIGPRRYFRQLIEKDGKRYVCHRFNPPGDQSFSNTDIKLIQRIIPAREVFDE